MPGLITYRPTGTRYVSYACCVALVAMSVAITVGLPQEIRDQVVLSQALTLYGCVLAMMAILHGMGRSYVRVDDHEIEVLNGYRRHVLPWDRVKGFAYPDGAPWPTMVTRSDDRIMLFAIQGRDDSDDVVKDLVRRVPR